MKVDDVIQIFTSLADCNTTKELAQTMQHIIDQQFNASAVKIYELIPARVITDEQLSHVVYKDIDTYEVVGRVEDNEQYYQAFGSRSPIENAKEDGTKEVSIPVVLSDLNISHMISLKHSSEPTKSNEVLLKIMLAFASLYRTLHEKNFDPLTRVLNRQAFEEACIDLEYFRQNANQTSITPFGVIAIIDIDFFKTINDRYGHAIGDEILVLFCQLVSSIIRDEDKFFRIGGEEFVLFLRLKDLSAARSTLERYRKAISERSFPQVKKLTVSIGFTSLKSTKHPMTQLAKADRALYYAKDNGRNIVCSYDDLLEQGLIEKVADLPSKTEFWDK